MGCVVMAAFSSICFALRKKDRCFYDLGKHNVTTTNENIEYSLLNCPFP